MQCPFCFSTDTEEVSDDRYLCLDCDDYFDLDEAVDEYDEGVEEEEDYL